MLRSPADEHVNEACLVVALMPDPELGAKVYIDGVKAGCGINGKWSSSPKGSSASWAWTW